MSWMVILCGGTHTNISECGSGHIRDTLIFMTLIYHGPRPKLMVDELILSLLETRSQSAKPILKLNG